MKIFLIGLPGSGKTTLGKPLAEKLQCPFIDLDAAIERQEGKSVHQIFSEKGEDSFRKIESTTLKSLIEQPASFVLATGGGTPCFFEGIELMNQSGKTIFLDVPIAEIFNRLQQTNLVERPLFADLNPEQVKNKLADLRAQRLLFYNQAQIILSQPKILVDQIIEKI